MCRDLRDSVPVILASILMFFIPKDPSFIYSWSRDRKGVARHPIIIIKKKILVPKIISKIIHLRDLRIVL